MNTPHNIKHFDRITAEVLSFLYSSFPVQVPLSLYKLFGLKHSIDADKLTEEEEFITSSLEWLKKAGYIDFSECRNEPEEIVCSHAVLTAKGLESMHSVPKSLSSSQTIGEFLQSSLKSGTSAEIENAVHLVITKGISLISAL